MTSTPFHNVMNAHATNPGGAYTANGAVSNAAVDVTNTHEGRLSWFFKGIRGLNPVWSAQYLSKAMDENIVDTVCLVMNTRDVLGGKGERTLGRTSFQWLLINYPEVMEKVFHLIPEYGRWDDLYTLFPRALKLDDLVWVNGNYSSNISIKTLQKARDVQSQIVVFYKNQLQKDWSAMTDGKPMSLAAKWAETEGSGDDRRYGLVQQICTEWKLHPKGYRVRVGEMRTTLGVVEKLCCGKQWSEIDYSKVPSQTMKKLKKAFDKNDHERFQEWLHKLKVKDPTVKVNAKTLHPHQLVKEYLNLDGWTGKVADKQDPVVEAQWSALLKRVRKSGALEKTIVISDVSGSMYSGQTPTSEQPIFPCIALSLLIARTSKAPWNNSLIAFSERPSWHQLRGHTLHGLCQEICSIPQGLSTNFQACFDMILDRYHQYKLKPEDLPEKVVCISDMQFDLAGRSQTNLAAIDEKYKKAGLRRPTLVFWNVNSNLDFPATTKDQNLCLIGGFSPSIMESLITKALGKPTEPTKPVVASPDEQVEVDSTSQAVKFAAAEAELKKAKLNYDKLLAELTNLDKTATSGGVEETIVSPDNLQNGSGGGQHISQLGTMEPFEADWLQMDADEVD